MTDFLLFKRKHEMNVHAAYFVGGPENAMELCKWMGNGAAYIAATKKDPREYLRVPTPFGDKTVKIDTWIVRSGEPGDYSFLPFKSEQFHSEFEVVTDSEHRLVKHAREELSRFPNEEPDYIEHVMDTIKAFSQYRGHSGASAEISIKMITMLLNGFNLLPLTDDPEEWDYKPGKDYGIETDYWQNKRNSAALTTDPELKTYFLANDQVLEDGTKKMYDTESKDFVPEIEEEDLKSDDEKEGEPTDGTTAEDVS